MFTIQLGHPKINTLSDTTFRKVRDVMLKLFHQHEEQWFLLYQDTPIAFSYQQDLYQSFDDIVALNWILQKQTEGQTVVKLNSELFLISITVRWKEEELVADFQFEAHEPLYKSYEAHLNLLASIQTSKSEFQSEWRTLLRQIITSVKVAGVDIEDGTERRKWELLQQTESKIPNYGKLYVRS